MRKLRHDRGDTNTLCTTSVRVTRTTTADGLAEHVADAVARLESQQEVAIALTTDSIQERLAWELRFIARDLSRGRSTLADIPTPCRAGAQPHIWRVHKFLYAAKYNFPNPGDQIAEKLLIPALPASPAE